jgi:outer membrane protein
MRTKTVIVCCTVWACVALVQAQERQLKIGYVDLDRVAELSSTIRQSADRLEQELLEHQKSIDQKREEQKRLKTTLELQETILTQEQVEQRKKELQTLTSEIDDLEYRLNKTLRKSEKEFIEPTFNRIMKAIENVSKAEGYDLVIRSDAVLYGRQVYDLTPKVILQLDTTAADVSTSPSREKQTEKKEE